MGGLLGGPKGMLAPPSQIIGGAWPPPGPPSSYAYVLLDEMSDIITGVIITQTEPCKLEALQLYKISQLYSDFR